MRYFVYGANGQRFGPADSETLTAWAQQGRVAAHTVLEEEETGVQIRADQLDELRVLLSPPPRHTGPASAPPPRQTGPCPNCGRPMVLGAGVCETCGASVSSTPEGRFLLGPSADLVVGLLAVLLLFFVGPSVFYGLGSRSGLGFISPWSGLAVLVVAYILMKSRYPAFARGMLNGFKVVGCFVLIGVALLLGLFAVCSGMKFN